MSQLKPNTQIDGMKRKYVLGPVVASGGEGTVYRVGTNLAVKFYHRQLDPQKRLKLLTQAQMHRPSLAAVSTWPIDVVYDANKNIIGYVMPLVRGGVPIGNLFSPAERKRLYPHATYANLVALAANLSRAVTAIHNSKFVIGDFNPQNVIVLADFTVCLIDTDSYQIIGHLCPVGVEAFTAPELFGKNLAVVPRSSSSDDFALAVIIFHLLVLGRHPFAGSPHPTLVDAMKKGDYLFRKRWRGQSPLTTQFGLSPYDFFTAPVEQLFVRAFLSKKVSARPTALEWMHALEDLLCSLLDCNHNVTHRYPPSTGWCPWCHVERYGRPALFQPTPQARLGAPRVTYPIPWWRVW